MNLLRALVLFSLAIYASTIPTRAQETSDEMTDGAHPGAIGFWEVVAADGRFLVPINQIVSVSQHEYLIDGTVRIVECTIDTAGNQTARFYYLEPVTGGVPLAGERSNELLKEVTDKATEKLELPNLGSAVIKHYPQTTHAKTSEYRVKRRETISQIYNNLRLVWTQKQSQQTQNLLIIVNG